MAIIKRQILFDCGRMQRCNKFSRHNLTPEKKLPKKGLERPEFHEPNESPNLGVGLFALKLLGRYLYLTEEDTRVDRLLSMTTKVKTFFDSTFGRFTKFDYSSNCPSDFTVCLNESET